MSSIRFLNLLILTVLIGTSCRENRTTETVYVYTDSVVTDVSRHPVGMNVDFFMDGDLDLKRSRNTTDALKAMGVRYLRYPGGDKSDLNLFSVPPYEKSVPTLARTGKGAVDDSANILDAYKVFRYDVLDFDEFMTMCRKLDAEPVIVVPADSYLKDYPAGCTFTGRDDLIKNAAEWVRYANIKKNYGIKYWMVGNECWNPNNPNSTAEIYARDVLDFATAMKAVDTTITISANGNNEDFFKPVIQIAGDVIDFLTLSNYPVWNYSRGYLTYRDTLQDLIGPVDRAVNAINFYGTEDQKKRLKIIISEFGPFDWAGTWPHTNDMGHNLANFEMAGEQLLRPEVEFSCFWNTRWTTNDTLENSVFDALDKEGLFNANGYGLMIWGNYLGEQMVRTLTHPDGVGVPRRGGSVLIRSFASIDRKQGKLFIYLINKSDTLQSVHLVIPDQNIKEATQAWELFGRNSDDCDPVWQKKDSREVRKNIRLKPVSITVVEYHLTLPPKRDRL